MSASAELNTEKPKVFCRICGELDAKVAASQGTEVEYVWCKSCGSAHHRKCWEYLGQCSDFTCGSRKYIIKEEATVVDGEIKVTTVRLPTNARAESCFVGVDGQAQNLTSAHTRLDLDTPLEKILQALVIVCLVAGLGLMLWYRAFAWWMVIATLTAAILMMVIRLNVECTYLLDNGKKEILFARSIFGWQSTWKICGFSDVEFLSWRSALGLGGKPESARFAVIMGLPGQLRVQISDWTDSKEQVDAIGRQLATHLGAEWLEPGSEEDSRLWKTGSPGQTAVERDWDRTSFFRRANPGWVVFAFVLAALNIILFVLYRMGKL